MYLTKLALVLCTEDFSALLELGLQFPANFSISGFAQIQILFEKTVREKMIYNDGISPCFLDIVCREFNKKQDFVSLNNNKLAQLRTRISY